MTEKQTDQELLELAAKAAGVETKRDEHGLMTRESGPFQVAWNPLTDDGDALRLAVKLKMSLSIFHDGAEANTDDDPANYGETNANDPCAATRRAIVRAAAEIGRSMK